jgi:hypothetical protein
LCGALQVYFIVDQDGNGSPDAKGTVLTDINTPNGVAIQGDDLYVSGFKNGKGIIWKLSNAHSYSLQGKVSRPDGCYGCSWNRAWQLDSVRAA